MSKRQSSIIPIAREHHDSLLLAHRLQQGEKALARTWSYDPIKQSHTIVDFYELHLAQHFEIEEKILFPFIDQHIPTAIPLTKELTDEHRKVEQIITELRQKSVENLTAKLHVFGELLESHIRKEDRQLFPMVEEQISRKPLAELEKCIRKFYKEHRNSIE